MKKKSVPYPKRSCWKSHPTLHNLLISKRGEVFSKGIYLRSRGGLRFKKGKLLTPVKDKDGYSFIGHRKRSYKIHRLVLETFVGKSDQVVNHKNGKKSDNRLENLEYLSHSQNTKHAFQIGSMKKKFCGQTSKQIISKYKQGASQNYLSQLFSTTPGTIKRILVENRIPIRAYTKKSRSQNKVKIVQINCICNKKDEVWKQIIGYENIYEISNFGKIRSSRGIISTRRTTKGKQIIVQLNKNKQRKEHIVAELIFASFYNCSLRKIKFKDQNSLHVCLTNLLPDEMKIHGVYHTSTTDLEGEIWQNIPGVVKYYQVSNYGRVKSCTRIIVETGTNKQYIRSAKILRPALDKGYFKVRLYNENNLGSSYWVHRLVLKAFLEEKPDHECNHKDGNKLNNSLSNLEYVNRKKNMLHAHRLGLIRNRCRGVSRYNSKLSEKDVLEIRKLHLKGVSLLDISSTFSVSYSCAYHIVRNLSWKHLPYPPLP